MSLVSTYCYCSDGLWYKNPTWKGYDESGELRWFLCLDDDDPPEMVLRVDDYPENTPKEERAKYFPELDFIRYTSRPDSFRGSLRIFGGRFKRASARWCEFTKVPPRPQSPAIGRVELPPGDKTFYDLRNQHKGKI